MRESSVDQDGLQSSAGSLSERGGASGENGTYARNQALFREVNERIEELALGVGGHEPYLCECGNPQCTEPMELTRAEYEAVREHANRFAVLPAHENAATETVVFQRGHYSVIEILAGEDSGLAGETDPRSSRRKMAADRE